MIRMKKALTWTSACLSVLQEIGHLATSDRVSYSGIRRRDHSSRRVPWSWVKSGVEHFAPEVFGLKRHQEDFQRPQREFGIRQPGSGVEIGRIPC